MFAMDTKFLLSSIIDHAKQRGLNQEALARRAHISAENISRMKKRNNAEVDTLIRLAEAAGLQLALTPATPEEVAPVFRAATEQPKFRQVYRHLAWSNKHVEDDVLLRKSLLDPHFDQILHAAKEFGVDKLREIWRDVQKRHPSQARAVYSDTERMLTNIERAKARVAKSQDTSAVSEYEIEAAAQALGDVGRLVP